jgi:hypothetical protein
VRSDVYAENCRLFAIIINSSVSTPVSHDNKAQQLDSKLARIPDPHVRMCLLLQQAFGLRREECIKVSGNYTGYLRGVFACIKATSCLSSLWPINHAANPNINELIVFIE